MDIDLGLDLSIIAAHARFNQGRGRDVLPHVPRANVIAIFDELTGPVDLWMNRHDWIPLRRLRRDQLVIPLDLEHLRAGLMAIVGDDRCSGEGDRYLYTTTHLASGEVVAVWHDGNQETERRVYRLTEPRTQ